MVQHLDNIWSAVVLGGHFSLMDVEDRGGADTLYKVTDGLQDTYKVTYVANVPEKKGQ